MAAFEGLRGQGEMPTAVICSNDMTAIGVMRSAYAAGVRIPGDLSVVGFDDIRFAQFTTPPLTTVQMSRVSLARAAFQALRDHSLPANGSAPREYAIPTRLIVRNSTDVPSPSRPGPGEPVLEVRILRRRRITNPEPRMSSERRIRTPEILPQLPQTPPWYDRSPATSCHACRAGQLTIPVNLSRGRKAERCGKSGQLKRLEKMRGEGDVSVVAEVAFRGISARRVADCGRPDRRGGPHRRLKERGIEARYPGAVAARPPRERQAP